MNPKQFLLAFSVALAALADNIDANASDSTPGDGEGTSPEPKRRGRPPGSSNNKTPELTPAASSALGYEGLKKLIEPLLKDGRAVEVKATIAKYSDEGLKGIPADKEAAFSADLEALSL